MNEDREMSTTPTPPPSEPRGVSPELKEMLNFISTENDRNREFFNDLFEKSRTFLIILLTAISVGVGLVGYKTISDAKKSAEDTAASAVKNRLDELKPRIDQQIADRVSAEFATPKIDKLVGDAADSATERLADPLIRKQVGSAVSQIKDKVLKQTDSEINRVVGDTVTPQLKHLVTANAEATQFAYAKTGDGISTTWQQCRRIKRCRSKFDRTPISTCQRSCGSFPLRCQQERVAGITITLRISTQIRSAQRILPKPSTL
jgi:hypothetical protein